MYPWNAAGLRVARSPPVNVICTFSGKAPGGIVRVKVAPSESTVGSVAPAGPTVSLVSTVLKPGNDGGGGGGGPYWRTAPMLAPAAVASPMRAGGDDNYKRSYSNY